ncbi:MurR/RpiR family transcriptional regulator [Solibacillus sp. FSL K6-1781]|uniref:MurR/RpiR family transcriptional regulator n=1 Tax=Solibacillus sp. FSL K6-1781 TaxID=2921474 RepID=UPI00315A9B3D
MSNMDIFASIKSRYNVFTNTERKVADYINENGKEVIYMSITDLAEACNVGEASVFRFCKTLDLKGYQEFKIVLAHSISLEDEMPQISNEITLNDSFQQLSSKILASNVQALSETYNLLLEQQLKEAVELLVNAERIHFFGVGSSGVTALEAKNKFMRITNKTEYSIDAHFQMMSAALMHKEDVAVIFSYSGSTKDTIELAEVIKKRGAKIILITRFAKSPLTTFSNVTLLCGAKEGPLQGGSLSVKIAQLYILDLLYFGFIKETKSESLGNKELTAQAVITRIL